MTQQQRLERVSGLFSLLNSLRGVDFGGHPACAEADPEMFFPISEDDVASVETARQVCADCPVRQACLEFAVRRGEHGIWGGTTEGERAELVRARRGTTSTGVLAGQDGCEEVAA